MILPRIVNVWTNPSTPHLNFVEFATTYEGRFCMVLMAQFNGRVVHSTPLSF